ncbi:MAG: glycosyltransferase [Dehalococcoidia bacterium]|nr:MAG: glycosyltransferase [Dehalococcoidia bacterium]
MLQKVSLGVKDINNYRMLLDSGLIDEVEALARDLKGLRLCHINSTPFGGGVAELLFSYIPMVRGLGIHADWQVIRGDLRFFTITKSLHNALQGAQYPLLDQQTKRMYLANNQQNAQELDPNYDVFVINDPQPAALRHFCDGINAKWIWRCHIDSSEPDKDTWQFLRPHVEEHDAAIFTTENFVPSDLSGPRIAIIPPAIDPLSTKNMPLPKAEVCRTMIDNLGLDRNRPLIIQVSRFDLWKDPFGVIEVYKLAREKVPGLQLALVGSMANDDPEGWELYAAIHNEADKYEDVHVFSNLNGVGNMEVNAFQRASDVVIQKSIREGFGLVVAEALWKGTPVVAGNVGGIPLQMVGTLSNFLVDTLEECAEKVVYLLQHPEVSEELGKEGMAHIKNNFLTPRLIRDELSLVKELVGA